MTRLESRLLPNSHDWRAALLFFMAANSNAQIATDGSLGQNAKILVGPDYVISEDLGALAGDNLFHSFYTFNIGSGESATFRTTTPELSNVISRVTGGHLSQINGALRLEAVSGQPAFFFINPAGVVIGEGASVDVPGAFRISTGDYLLFADGSEFHADLSETSTLASAPPEAFGFLGTHNSSLLVEKADLFLSPRQSASLVAGDLTIKHASVSVPAGDIQLAAVGTAPILVPLATTVVISDPQESDGQALLLSSRIEASGDGAGRLQVYSGPLFIDASELVVSNQGDSSAADSQGVIIHSTDVSILSGGLVTTTATSGGDAADIRVSSESLVIDSGGTGDTTGILSAARLSSTGDAGNVNVSVTGLLSILNGAQINSRTIDLGDGGDVGVNAGSLEIDGQSSGRLTGIFSSGDSSSTGAYGTVTVSVAGAATIVNGGQVSSSTLSVRDSGNVFFSAGDLFIDRQDSFFPTGIATDSAHFSQGNAGNVDVVVSRQLSLVNGGTIASDTFSLGDGGRVSISAESLNIDGHGKGFPPTGIFSQASRSSGGNGGAIGVEVAEAAAILNGGQVSTNTFSIGNAGTIDFSAGELTIDSLGSFAPTDISSVSSLPATGRGGSVEVSVRGMVSILNGGSVSTDTFSSGDAGSVRMRSASLLIDDQQHFFQTGIFSETVVGSGNAGTVDLSIEGSVTVMSGAVIATGTNTSGNAGTILLHAGSLLLDGSNQAEGSSTGIFNDTAGTGNAGLITVDTTGSASLLNNGLILASTFSEGKAGSIQLSVGKSLLIEGSNTGVAAQAREFSSGQIGSVTITAGEAINLSNGGVVSIDNRAFVPDPTTIIPTNLRLTAPQISLVDASISAEASENVAASAIVIAFSELLSLNRGSINTTAQDGNGGSILLIGGQLSWLTDSEITTSVAGSAGDGGDISINTNTLLMETGFIQANTAAAGAQGGNITIEGSSLVASGNSVLIGGDTQFVFQPGVFGYNVIQAAAPDGVSGTISITPPELDLSGSLIGIGTRFLDPGGLGRNPCNPGGGSTLSWTGRGGLPALAMGSAPAALEVSSTASSGNAVTGMRAAGCAP